MFVEFFILFLMLCVLFFEFNTLSLIFINFTRHLVSVTFNFFYRTIKEENIDSNGSVSSKKRIKKFAKNQVKNQTTRVKEKSKTKSSIKIVKQDDSKVDKSITKRSDKSVKVSTDKKPSKTVLSNQGLLARANGKQKDKEPKNKDTDNNGDWIVVQKKVKKLSSIRSNEPSRLQDAKNSPVSNILSSQRILKDKNVTLKSSNLVKPLFKETVPRAPLSASIPKASVSTKINNTDPKNYSKLVAKSGSQNNMVNATESNLNLSKKILGVSEKNHSVKKTTNELAKEYYRIKEHKAENDSKQYLVIADHNKKKFQTDYAKTVFRKNSVTSAWSADSKSIFNSDIDKSVSFNETENSLSAGEENCSELKVILQNNSSAFDESSFSENEKKNMISKSDVSDSKEKSSEALKSEELMRPKHVQFLEIISKKSSDDYFLSTDSNFTSQSDFSSPCSQYAENALDSFSFNLRSTGVENMSCEELLETEISPDQRSTSYQVAQNFSTNQNFDETSKKYVYESKNELNNSESSCNNNDGISCPNTSLDIRLHTEKAKFGFQDNPNISSYDETITTTGIDQSANEHLNSSHFISVTELTEYVQSSQSVSETSTKLFSSENGTSFHSTNDMIIAGDSFLKFDQSPTSNAKQIMSSFVTDPEDHYSSSSVTPATLDESSILNCYSASQNDENSVFNDELGTSTFIDSELIHDKATKSIFDKQDINLIDQNLIESKSEQTYVSSCQNFKSADESHSTSEIKVEISDANLSEENTSLNETNRHFIDHFDENRTSDFKSYFDVKFSPAIDDKVLSIRQEFYENLSLKDSDQINVNKCDIQGTSIQPEDAILETGGSDLSGEVLFKDKYFEFQSIEVEMYENFGSKSESNVEINKQELTYHEILDISGKEEPLSESSDYIHECDTNHESMIEQLSEALLDDTEKTIHGNEKNTSDDEGKIYFNENIELEFKQSYDDLPQCMNEDIEEDDQFQTGIVPEVKELCDTTIEETNDDDISTLQEISSVRPNEEKEQAFVSTPLHDQVSDESVPSNLNDSGLQNQVEAHGIDKQGNELEAAQRLENLLENDSSRLKSQGNDQIISSESSSTFHVQPFESEKALDLEESDENNPLEFLPQKDDLSIKEESSSHIQEYAHNTDVYDSLGLPSKEKDQNITEESSPNDLCDQEHESEETHNSEKHVENDSSMFILQENDHKMRNESFQSNSVIYSHDLEKAMNSDECLEMNSSELAKKDDLFTRRGSVQIVSFSQNSQISSQENNPLSVDLSDQKSNDPFLENLSEASKDVTSDLSCTKVVNYCSGVSSINNRTDFNLEKMPSQFNYRSENDIIGKMSSPKMVSNNIRILRINDNEHKDSTLYRLEKGWTLEIRLGPSLFGRKVKIFVNYPEKGKKFNRNEYRSLCWSNASSHDDCSKFCQIQLDTSGSFHYYFTYDGNESRNGSGYFLVDPVLTAGNETIPLDCIQAVTYLSKLLGPFSSWENKLRVAKESGYNMVHFTPIQELGGSNSAYSLQSQLSLNPVFNENNREITYKDVTQLTNKLRNEWKMLSICDIVLNHTANESPWLQEHPECSYNLINSPHLKPAYLLDITLFNLSIEVKEGKWEFSGIPRVVNCEEHLSAIKHALYSSILPRVKISELFLIDVNKLVLEFQTQSRNKVPPAPTTKIDSTPLKLIPDPEFRRLAATVDMNHALSLFNIYRGDCFDEDTRLKKCSEEFKKCLEKLNEDIHNRIQGHLNAAVENFVAGVRYFRVQSDGPRLTEVSEKNPLGPRYFTDYKNEPSEDVMYTPDARFIMAHNGWVMDADPLRNFAAADSDVYLRRELIAWGDSVKLRYGEKPEDCPFLWNHMKEYVERTVEAFDGVRLDNCHSTPIVVAQYLLDAGRKIKPDLYVVGELFTNSDDKDNIFVNKLGITSLIREAMSAWNSHEEGRLVYRYGGVPVGAFIQPLSRPLVPSVAHALFLDLTHDNPSPVEKRTVFDLLPSSALVSMACCASGSNMGYDLLVPHHIHVVEENRQYLEWGKDVNLSTGIIAGKCALNNLHYTLGKQGYSQVFVDQVDSDIVCVTRHNDITHETVILIAYTAFGYPGDHMNGVGKGVTVSGQADSVILEASLSHRTGSKYQRSTEYVRNPSHINGLSEYVLHLREHIDLKESTMLDFVALQDGSTRVNFTSQFKPGSVVSVKIKPHPNSLQALQKLSTKQDLRHVISELSLVDLNKALFCCAEEEGGCYDIPGFGPLVYAGLQGLISLLSTIAPNNDLGHPLCANLRNGHWLMDYVSSRLKKYPGTKRLGDCLEQLFTPLKDIPRFLVPSYFNVIVMQVYEDLLSQVWIEMSEFVRDGSAFCKRLALGSVQLGSIVSSSPLPPLSANVLPPKPSLFTFSDGHLEQACASLAAGLPHFSHGYMRNWGRDTFIALRGLFLLTGRYDEARYIILAFGGCLRHGLIPNLLDGGKNPRYNCRDAFWWWLYTVQCYVEIVPQGSNILNDVVNRIFPTDDSPNSSVDQPLHKVIQEGMAVHFQGLCFRERNAGTAIDAHMVSQGFDNQIGINPNTGFVFGGNEWNCGTWMDKMGSSEKAGTKGRPATPRDGSAVELIGLSKAAVRWLAEMNEKNLYPYNSVTRTNKDGTSVTWTYSEWNSRIQNNFEKHFWVSLSPDPNEKRPDLINRKGIYKDTYGATQAWSDYQLRPNFPIAMVVAPELFTPSNAWEALKSVEKFLVGPLGMKTLDPSDWCYNGNYDNSNDSSDAKVAHGFNYHQGPEWLWPLGFFLRAKLIFAEKAMGHAELDNTLSKTRALLSSHYTHLESSLWRGLPELTNQDGAFCPGSCTVQAWSMSTLLEVLDDISKLEIEAGFENISNN